MYGNRLFSRGFLLMNPRKCQLISADYAELSVEDGKVPHAAQSKLSFKLNPNMLTQRMTPRQRIFLISIAAVFHVSFFPPCGRGGQAQTASFFDTIKNLSLVHCVVKVWTELILVLLEAVRVNLRANSPRRLIRHPNPNPHTTPRFPRL